MQITMDNLGNPSIRWDANFWWEVYIPTMNKPFDNWIPAVSVTEGLLFNENYMADYIMTRIPIPRQEGSTHNLSITMYDNSERTLERWWYGWVYGSSYGSDDMSTTGSGMVSLQPYSYDTVTTRLLKQVARNIQIMKYDSMGNIKAMSDYQCIPAETSYQWTGDNSGSSIRQVTYDMYIVGGYIQYTNNM